MRKYLALCLLAVCLPASAASLGDLVAERLGWMEEVAAWKYRRSLPVEDPDREAAVLADVADKAFARGIDPAAAMALFRAQIEAAKSLQRLAYARWDAGEPVPAARDLATEVRPALTALTAGILAAARRPAPGDDTRGALARVAGLPVADRNAIAEAVAALRPLARTASLLDLVQARGLLRVGTTGDYAPFSWRTGGGFAGLDIELAQDLAASLGVGVEWVETSWPTLVQDLEAGRFDIAMSGISTHPSRARVGFFSVPYHEGGKTPIGRCSDRSRLGSLAAIDQPGVRVIVNPGGTNERVTRALLSRAPIAVHPDNTTIFREIAEGRADVMLTDRIEVVLQARRDDRLCALTGGQIVSPLTKAALLRRDPAWKHYVDIWLGDRLRAGTVEVMRERAISGWLDGRD